LDDPSPSPSREKFSSEFCSFIDACLQKDPEARPTAEQVNYSSELISLGLEKMEWKDIMFNIFFSLVQLLRHPFIKKHENSQVDLGAFVRSVFDPVQRLKDLADVSF